MTWIRRCAPVCSVAAVLIVLGSVAAAGGSGLTLNYVLTGPAINGVVPSGKATLDEPRLPGTLTCEVQNVNLPDGTSLDVVIAFTRVGTLNLSRGQAKLQTTVPFQVRADPFDIEINGVTIMTARWKN